MYRSNDPLGRFQALNLRLEIADLALSGQPGFIAFRELTLAQRSRTFALRQLAFTGGEPFDLDPQVLIDRQLLLAGS